MIASNPDTFQVSVKEVLTLQFDFTNYLTAETVTGGSATLTNKLTGSDASSAISNVSAASPNVSLKLTCTGLAANMDYLLIVAATKSNGDTEVMETVIKAVA